jgi:hypothetical protein
MPGTEFRWSTILACQNVSLNSMTPASVTISGTGSIYPKKGTEITINYRPESENEENQKDPYFAYGNLRPQAGNTRPMGL